MITGGIKFFSDNVALSANGGIIASATSGSIVASNIIDKLASTYWTSVSSTDLITETLVINFTETSISRLHLKDFNFKSFTVKYWNGSAWTHFANVLGIDGAKTNITETAFADSSAYYEFTAVTTASLQIAVTTAQVADAQKYLSTLFVGNELGTLSGFPEPSPVLDPKARSSETLSGRTNTVKQAEVFSCGLNFSNYPVAELGADVALMLTLIRRGTPFYMWLCGGRRGSTYFSYAMPAWGLSDLYRVQLDSAFASNWSANLYRSGTSLGDLLFKEHV